MAFPSYDICRISEGLLHLFNAPQHVAHCGFAFVLCAAGEKWKAILFATMTQITVGVAKDLVKLGACAPYPLAAQIWSP